MAELEQRVENLETRVMTVERHVDQVMTKLDMFIEESREIRRRQDADRQRQDAEIRELRQRQDAAQAKHDADMREIRQDMKDMQKNIYAKMDTMDAKIENIGNHVRNMFLVALGGIAAMVVAVFLK